MTLEQIHVTAVTLQAAKEAHTQAAKRLDDALATKESLERKATSLLSAYVALSLASFAAFRTWGDQAPDRFGPGFFFAGAVCAVGAALAAAALWPRTYAVAGSDPAAWLRPGVIDGDEHAVARVLAFETRFHLDRIATSVAANEHKASLIRGAVGAGLSVPVALAVLLLLG